MKVALVHDYLREYGGAERVLEALHEIFPDSPVYVAYYNPATLGVHADRIKDWDIRTSWLQRVLLAQKLISPFRVFAPMMFESFDLKPYDVVISSCNVYFSKAVITRSDALHISYIHTPPRYLYGYATTFNYKKHWWTRIAGELANHFLRMMDYETSQRPDILVANSKNVAKRIEKFYRRKAEVIYPPVDMEEFKGKSVIPAEAGIQLNNYPNEDNLDRSINQAHSSNWILNQVQDDKQYFLSLNRLARGKGTEVGVKACSDLGVPLKVAGGGPELENLKKMAGETIEFLGEVTDEERVRLLKNAKALIVASEEEDFGITPVEAMAAGTPVVAIRTGGFLETVIPGKTGEFFDHSVNPANPNQYFDPETVANLEVILKDFDPKKYDSKDCVKQAEKFSQEQFKKQILELIKKHKKT